MFTEVKKVWIDKLKKQYVRDEDGRYVRDENGARLVHEEVVGTYPKVIGYIYQGNKVFTYTYSKAGGWKWSYSVETVWTNDRLESNDLFDAVVYDGFLDKKLHPVLEEKQTVKTVKRSNPSPWQVVKTLAKKDGLEKAMGAVKEITEGCNGDVDKMNYSFAIGRLQEMSKEDVEDVYTALMGQTQRSLDFARKQTKESLVSIVGATQDEEEEETKVAPPTKYVVVDEDAYTYCDSGLVDLCLSFSNVQTVLDHCPGRIGKPFFTSTKPITPVPYDSLIVIQVEESKPEPRVAGIRPAKVTKELASFKGKVENSGRFNLYSKEPKNDKETILSVECDDATYVLESFYNGKHTVMQAVKMVGGMVESYSETIRGNVNDGKLLLAGLMN